MCGAGRGSYDRCGAPGVLGLAGDGLALLECGHTYVRICAVLGCSHVCGRGWQPHVQCVGGPLGNILAAHLPEAPLQHCLGSH